MFVRGIFTLLGRMVHHTVCTSPLSCPGVRVAVLAQSWPLPPHWDPLIVARELIKRTDACWTSHQLDDKLNLHMWSSGTYECRSAHSGQDLAAKWIQSVSLWQNDVSYRHTEWEAGKAEFNLLCQLTACLHACVGHKWIRLWKCQLWIRFDRVSSRGLVYYGYSTDKSSVRRKPVVMVIIGTKMKRLLRN